MGRTLEQILQNEKPAVVADAKAKAEAILAELEISGDSASGPGKSSPGSVAKSAPRDQD